MSHKWPNYGTPSSAHDRYEARQKFGATVSTTASDALDRVKKEGLPPVNKELSPVEQQLQDLEYEIDRLRDIASIASLSTQESNSVLMQTVEKLQQHACRIKREALKEII
jgi:hypothetical protein